MYRSQAIRAQFGCDSGTIDASPTHDWQIGSWVNEWVDSWSGSQVGILTNTMATIRKRAGTIDNP